MLSYLVFADREPRPSLPASFRFLRSSSSSLFFSGDCALFPATAVSQTFYYPFLAHSFHRHGGCTPSFASFFPVLPNSFTCHTSETSPSNSNHCHTSKTGVSNPRVCHTSETPGGRGVLLLTRPAPVLRTQDWLYPRLTRCRWPRASRGMRSKGAPCSLAHDRAERAYLTSFPFAEGRGDHSCALPS